MDQASSPAAGMPTKYCVACGRLLDARAEICPGCGVRQQMVPGLAAPVAVGQSPSRTGSVSGLAVALSLLAALVGSVGQILLRGSMADVFTYAFAAAWGLPLVGVAVAYLSRMASANTAAGGMLGIGLLGLGQTAARLVYGLSEGWGPSLFTALDDGSAGLAVLASLAALRARSR